MEEDKAVRRVVKKIDDKSEVTASEPQTDYGDKIPEGQKIYWRDVVQDVLDSDEDEEVKTVSSEFMNKGVNFIYDADMALHKDYSESHPECPARILAIYELFEKKKLLEKFNILPCPKATVDQLKLVHSEKVIDRVFKTEEIKDNKNTQWFDRDNYECKYTKDAALLSCGGTIQGNQT